jgi:hypothetical protein
MGLAATKTLLMLTLAAGALAPAGFGQKKTPPPRTDEQKAARPAKSNAPAAKGPDAQKGAAPRQAPNPFTPIDRWNAMNPKQRERMLSRMEPERRKQFIDKLQKFNALPKAEQQLLRERHERLSNLPPDQQQVVRRDGARFEKLPPARRQAMLDEFQKVRKMSESERNAYFATPEFRDKFYPNEQQMIANLSKVIPVRK